MKPPLDWIKETTAGELNPQFTREALEGLIERVQADAVEAKGRELKALESHASQSDKELCELQDALGCPAELRAVKCNRCDWNGTSRDADVESDCPLLDCNGEVFDAGIADAQLAAMERIRDLIAENSELSTLRNKVKAGLLLAEELTKARQAVRDANGYSHSLDAALIAWQEASKL